MPDGFLKLRSQFQSSSRPQGLDARTMSTMKLIQPPIQRIPMLVFPGIKRPEHEANHCASSSVRVKNAWTCSLTPVPRTFSWPKAVDPAHTFPLFETLMSRFLCMSMARGFTFGCLLVLMTWNFTSSSPRVFMAQSFVSCSWHTFRPWNFTSSSPYIFMV